MRKSLTMNSIGKTGVSVSSVAFGCASIGNLGQAVSDTQSEQVLQYAWSQGISYFDTAPHYGRGLSEQRLGKFLRTLPRDQYTLSSKVGRVLSPGVTIEEADGYIQPLANAVRYDYSAAGIEESFEQSCERLGTSHIDILYVHDIGEYTHGADENKRHMSDLFSSGLDQLQKLKSSGRIKAFGLGVNENQVCLDVMAERPLDVILLAGRLTLLDRSAEQALVEKCSSNGTRLVLGGIFNSGILALGAVPGATFDYQPATADIVTQVQTLQKKVDAYSLPLATAALHFAKQHPAACSLLIGTSRVSSLQRNLDALDTELPEGAEQLFR